MDEAPQTTGLDLSQIVDDTRRLVLSRALPAIVAAGADPDDVLQEVYLRILELQAKHPYDPTRGMAPTTYVSMVGYHAALNAIRASGRRIHREIPDPDGEPDGPAEEGVGGVFWRGIFALLDLDQEREMAVHLAAGCSLKEIRRAMGLTEGQAAELRTRVRALLMPLRDEP